MTEDDSEMVIDSNQAIYFQQDQELIDEPMSKPAFNRSKSLLSNTGSNYSPFTQGFEGDRFINFRSPDSEG